MDSGNSSPAQQFAMMAMSATLLVSGLFAPISLFAQDHNMNHAGAGTEHKSAASDCHIPIALSQTAEERPGGALYRGGQHQNHGDNHSGEPHPDDMAGAHTKHDAVHGGTFFMAPNKLHHLEALYRPACGLQVFFYNAFTEPIRADRFDGFARVIPGSDDAFEVYRILQPSPDAGALSTPITPAPASPFEIELYLRFPGAEEPALFNILID